MTELSRIEHNKIQQKNIHTACHSQCYTEKVGVLLIQGPTSCRMCLVPALTDHLGPVLICDTQGYKTAAFIYFQADDEKSPCRYRPLALPEHGSWPDSWSPPSDTGMVRWVMYLGAWPMLLTRLTRSHYKRKSLYESLYRQGLQSQSL